MGAKITKASVATPAPLRMAPCELVRFNGSQIAAPTSAPAVAAATPGRPIKRTSATESQRLSTVGRNQTAGSTLPATPKHSAAASRGHRPASAPAVIGASYWR